MLRIVLALIFIEGLSAGSSHYSQHFNVKRRTVGDGLANAVPRDPLRLKHVKPTGGIMVSRKIQYRSADSCKDEHPPTVCKYQFPHYCENIGKVVNATGDNAICWANPGASLCYCRKSCGSCDGFMCADTNRPSVNCAALEHLCDDPAFVRIKCLCPKTCGNCENFSAVCCGGQFMVKTEL